MKDLVKIGNSFNIPLKTYIADFEEDLDIILKEEKPPVGSIVEVINTGIYKKYKLGNDLKWYEIPIESSGGGCNPEDYKLQEKRVVPSTAAQSVTPDDSYYGLSKVNVDKIPENYITTDDANATPEDLKIGKTAYVQGQKITGTKEDETYVLPLASENELGGIKASEKDELDVQECKINIENGKLYTQSFEDLLIVDKIEGNQAMSESSADWRIPLIEGYGESTQEADPTPEAPQEIKSSVVAGVKVIGKNLFDPKKLSGGEFVEFNGVQCYKYLDHGKNFTFDFSENIFNQITLKIKCYREQGNTNGITIKINYTDETTERVSLTASNSFEAVRTSKAGKKVKSITGDNNYNAVCYIDLTATQLENGGEDTFFQPYKEQSITFSAPITLRGIPSESGNITIDGTKYLSDYIGQKDGVYGVFRKTREDIDDGSQNWSVYNSPDGGFTKPFLKSAKLRLPGICNQGKVSLISVTVENTIFIGFNNTFLYFLGNPFYNSELPDKGLANWKAHLAENPLKIISVADEETFEPLPKADQQTLKQLKTFYPTSIISGITEDNSGIWIQANIVCDPKNYINNEITKITNEVQTQLLATNKALLGE